MKRNLPTRTIISLFFLFLINYCLSQKKSSDSIALAIAPVFTADSLASGNVKDIFTSFYQLAFNNLTSSTNKEFNFSSNPYALMLKNDPTLAKDEFYYKYRGLRKLNFGFGLKLDSSYKFNGFSSGIKYELLNKRDTTTSKLLFANLKNDPLNLDIKKLTQKISKFEHDSLPNKDANGNINVSNQEKHEIIDNNFDSLLSPKYIAFNKLDNYFQQLVKKIALNDSLNTLLDLINKTPNTSIKKVLDTTFTALKNEIKYAPLWTIGISDTTYKDQFFFSNIVFNTEFVKGIGKSRPGSNWEYDFKEAINLADDTLSAGRDLKRCLSNFAAGINWVQRNSKDQSYFEFKFSGNWLHNFSFLYANEKRDVVTADATIRIRIFDEFWIPLTIKYDVINHNFLGFLNVTTNFTSLGKLLNPQKL